MCHLVLFILSSDKSCIRINGFLDLLETPIDFLSEITARYLKAQIDAGADTVQLFES